MTDLFLFLPLKLEKRNLLFSAEMSVLAVPTLFNHFWVQFRYVGPIFLICICLALPDITTQDVIFLNFPNPWLSLLAN